VARSIWTGSISFGLVNIPVRVFSAVRPHDVRFHQVAPDGSRIHVERVSGKTGKKVDFGDLKKGYETAKGKWVLFDKGELDKLAPASTKTIDIEDFVALDDIDPIYYERTYHLAPQGEAAESAYALLASVMSERGRVGIGKVVMRDKQYLAAIRPYGKGLALSTMLFADEVVPQSDIEGVPARKKTVGAREKKLAGQILDSLESDWDPKRYHDDYEEQLRSIIRAKAKGKAVEVEEQPEPSAKVLDLVEALQASLEGRRPKRAAARPSRGTGTKRAKKATKKRAKKSAKKGRAHAAARRSA
jgi:DNA end-binding protein Ku